jgi:hypothetical protein
MDYADQERLYDRVPTVQLSSLDYLKNVLIYQPYGEGDADSAHNLARRTVVFTITAGDKNCELDNFYPARGRSCESRKKLLVI